MRHRESNPSLRASVRSVLMRGCGNSASCIAAVQMSFLLTHESDFQFVCARYLADVFAVVIAADDLSFDLERRDRAAQFVDVVRSDSFRIVSQHQRTGEIQAAQWRDTPPDKNSALLLAAWRARCLRGSGHIVSADRVLRADRSSRAKRATEIHLQSVRR